MTIVRPNMRILWPTYTLFPLAGLSVLVFGVNSRDAIMAAIGIALLALNAIVVANQMYCTDLRIVGDELVYRTNFGLHRESLPIGSLQRIDAKRYPAAHSGVSAPHFVARGRAATVKLNTKPYRLTELASLITTIRAANAQVQLDPFWSRVASGENPATEAALTPRSRW